MSLLEAKPVSSAKQDDPLLKETINDNLYLDTAIPHTTAPLRDSVKTAIERYFSQLENHEVKNFYDMVISEVEEPLLQTVMKITGGNQSKAADCLGLSRGTLRKKLEKYGML
jgi:Fis family transcriptional regulator